MVDHKGQVFKGKEHNELHPGLYVMDGAIVPRPLGTNPLLTISALAERSCKLIAEEKGLSLSYALDSFDNTLGVEGLLPTGVQFTETMKGYLSLNELSDYDLAYARGKEEHSSFEFTLTVLSEDVDSFVNISRHTAGLLGTMTAPQLSGAPLTALQGEFNLFIVDPTNPELKKMAYSAQLISEEGKRYYFEGFKEVHNDRGIDVWKDTTTLYIKLYEGDSSAPQLLGMGKLHIEVLDFMKQLKTIKAINPRSKLQGMKAVSTFAKFFAGNVYSTYFKKLK